MRSLKILRYSADRRTLAVIGGWYALLALQWNWETKPVWVTVLLLALNARAPVKAPDADSPA